MDKAIWVMSFDVRILPSSPIAMDDSEFAAGEAALFAKSNQDAESQLLQQLEGAKLQLVKLHQNTAFNGAKWIGSSEYRDDILELVEEVKFSEEFRFGVFRDPEGMDS